MAVARSVAARRPTALPSLPIGRQVFWTTSATLLASLQEVLLLRWWASGGFGVALFSVAPEGESHIPIDAPFWGTEWTPYFIAWTVTMLYWRILHFYIIHRAMHPWWDRKNGLINGDVGAFLYRHVHAHHHKVRSCGAMAPCVRCVLPLAPSL